MARPKPLHTRESIRALLQENPRGNRTGRTAVETALLRLYQYQTRQEQECKLTIEHNRVGFTAPDGKRNDIPYMIRWILSGQNLSGAWMWKAQEIVMKYCGQLARIANEQHETRLARMRQNYNRNGFTADKASGIRLQA